MAANDKRVIVIGIDNSDFAEKSFDCKYTTLYGFYISGFYRSPSVFVILYIVYLHDISYISNLFT